MGKEQVRLKPLAEFRSLLEVPGKFLLIPGEEITHKYRQVPGPHERHQPPRRHQAGRRPQRRRDDPGQSPPSSSSARRSRLADPRVPQSSQLRLGRQGRGHARARSCASSRSSTAIPASRTTATPSTRAPNACGTSSWRCGWASIKLPIVYGMATDDAHGYHSFGVGKVNPGRGWVMVKCPLPHRRGHRQRHDAGDFYSTTGVTLKNVHSDKEKLAIEIKGEPGVIYKTEFIATLRRMSLSTPTPIVDQGRQGTERHPALQPGDRQGRRRVRRSEALLPLHRQGALRPGQDHLDQAASEPLSEGRRGSGLDAAGGTVDKPAP